MIRLSWPCSRSDGNDSGKDWKEAHLYWAFSCDVYWGKHTTWIHLIFTQPWGLYSISIIFILQIRKPKVR